MTTRDTEGMTANDVRRSCVGVVITSDRSAGGAYQYAIQILESLAGSDPGFDVRVLDYNISAEVGELCRKFGLEMIACQGVLDRDGLLRRGWRVIRRSLPGVAQRIRKNAAAVGALRRRFQQVATEHDLDVLLLCEPSPLGFESGLGFLMPIHDLQHRMQREWPEVSADGESEVREHVYQNATRAARRILVDSAVGREDVVRLYEIAEERVRVLPFVGASCVRGVPSAAEISRVRAQYGLPERYFFYPAQFWYHKNHIRLARAMAILRDEHSLDLPLVLCGGKKNSYEEFERTVGELSLGELIRFLGYVPDEDMAGLYCGATALVFPTFFGPTNIPIIEAWGLGVPVVTSDIRGVREQVGEAALLADPRDERAMARQMRRVATDGACRGRLTRNGRAKIEAHTAADFAATLRGIIVEALESAVVDGQRV